MPARLATSSSRAEANPLAENSSSAASRMASRRAAVLAARASWRVAAMVRSAPPLDRPGPILSGRAKAALARCFAAFAMGLNMTDWSVIVKRAAASPAAAVTFCPWQRHSLAAAKLCYADNERRQKPIYYDRRLQPGSKAHPHANRDGRRQPLRLPLHQEIIS